jgi:hypothetical protein
LASIINAALQAPVVGKIKIRTWRVERQFWRFIPALRENRFDDVHS